MKQKKTFHQLFLLPILCLLSFTLSAQMSERVTKEDPYQSEIAHVLSPLDFKDVTTGLLKDRAFNFIPLHRFGDTLKTNNWVDLDRYGRIYATLFDASIDPRIKLPDPGPAYMNAWDTETIDTIIPMTILLYDYHQFREDAVKNNLLDTLNGQLHDVRGRSESPYEKKGILAMAPIQAEAPSLDVSFEFPSQLFHSNLSLGLDYLEVDFDNGRGYQSIDLNRSVGINYTQEGAKDIKIKAHLLDGRVLVSHSLVEVKERVVKTYDLDNPEPPVPVPSTSEHAGAVMNMVLSCPEEGLRKPLIVVEGWDPPQQPNTDYEDELRDFFRVFPYPGNSSRMSDILEDDDYDLVFIDYNYGSDHIARNAKAVRDAIRIINTLLEDNGSPEPINIIGLSMGGITSRMALIEMESQGEDHNTELLISMDSPLTGANVPYGLQHMVKHIADLNIGFFWDLEDFVPALDDATDLLKEPATKEMLYFNAFVDDDEDPVNYVHDAFYAALHQLPDPQDFEYVAISNGSVNGTTNEGRQTMPPGVKIVNINGTGAEFLDTQLDDNIWSDIAVIGAEILMYFGTGADIDIDVWSMPSFPSSDQKIYHGDIRVILFGIPILFSIRNSYVNGVPPIDSAPGGMTELPNEWIGENNLQDLVSAPYNSFCFVPTISSLDIYEPNSTNFYQDLSNYNNVIQNLSSFDRYIASTDASVFTYGDFQENQEHIDWNRRNAAFALSELTGNIDLASSTLQGRIYNFGRSNELFDPSFPDRSLQTSSQIAQDLSISGVEQIWVNRKGPIAFTDDPDNPDNRNNSSFDVFIKEDCLAGTDVTISNGGKLWIGQRSQASNNGHVYAEDGSTITIEDGGFIEVDQYSSLVIQDGATMTIEDGGRLRVIKEGKVVIEEGGKLIINEGALLDLWWSTATLHIKGELELNGQFKFDGSGYLQFDKTHTLTLNTDFDLKGKGVRFLQLNEGTQLKIGDRHLNLDDGIVKYGYNSSIQIGTNGTAFAERVTFSGSDTNSGGTGIYADGAARLDFWFCTFENLFTGIYATDGQVDQIYRNYYCNYNDCGIGLAIVDMPKFILLSTNFSANPNSGNAIVAHQVDYLSYGGGIIRDYNSSVLSVPAVELKEVTDANLSGVDLLNNRTGIQIEDVPELRLWGCEVKNSGFYGIYAPAGGSYPIDNNSNVFLHSGTLFEDNEVGVQIDKGGQRTDGSFYGKVLMNCSKMIHNNTGIQGEDIQLEIDALDHCDCQLAIYANPNTFIKNPGPQNAQKFFNICYVDLEGIITEVSARANYWEGGLNPGSDYILRHPNSSGLCEGTDFINLNTSDPATEEPDNCDNSGPDKPTEASTDRNRNGNLSSSSTEKLQVFPNPTSTMVTITMEGETFDLSIFNALGMQVYERSNATVQQQLDISDWPKGIYLIKASGLTTQNKWTQKLVIQ